MIQLLFSLRYQTQIRRTNPELYGSLEDFVAAAIRESGGVLGADRRCITASFDETGIGFWLNLLVLLERTGRRLEESSRELFGFICLVAPDLGDYGAALASSLPSGGSGIWCDPGIRQSLSPYADFEAPGAGPPRMPQGAGFARLRRIRSPFRDAPGTEGGFPFRERIPAMLRERGPRNVLIRGPVFSGKRDGICRYCRELSGDFPPLVVSFGTGGTGLCCVADALTPEASGIIAASGGKAALEELESLAGSVFRERFQEQPPVHITLKARRFLPLLLEAWERAAGARQARPVLVLENLNEAEDGAARLVQAVLGQRQFRKAFLVFGTWQDPSAGGHPPSADASSEASAEAGELWKDVFSGTLRLSPENPPPLPGLRDLSQDLLEITYALALLRRYYPPALFPLLFREAGLNAGMVDRALGMLAGAGVVDSAGDPRIRIPGFVRQAERMLGPRKDRVRDMVRERILAWEAGGRFRPSFRMVEAITSLGGTCPDALVLDSLKGDIINDTRRGIERAIRDGRFDRVVGENRAPPLLYIYRSSKALIQEGEAAIREAFLPSPPEADPFPVYKARIHANLASYHFGFHDIAAAEEMVKETLLLSQSRREGGGLSLAYRLFALTGIARQRLSDAIDYLTFAVENCERTGDLDELAVSACYAAGTQFLFGNISGAERLARQAGEAAARAGRLEWADRAWFLLGRFRFEAGRYGEARKIFEDLAARDIPRAQDLAYPPSGGDGGPRAERAAILSAWTYRAGVFLGEKDPPPPQGAGADARLFELEAAWLAGDYHRAAHLADQALAALPDTRFLLIERPDWWSGFAQTEFLLFQPRDFFTRLAASYRALALCRLGRTSDTARGEALDGMRRIIREEGLPPADPNDAFYHYAHYRVLQETGAQEVDMNTAVSMAFKRLQSRASRIDDTETKRAYLSENFWNGALSQAARKHKLI